MVDEPLGDTLTPVSVYGSPVAMLVQLTTVECSAVPSTHLGAAAAGAAYRQVVSFEVARQGWLVGAAAK